MRRPAIVATIACVGIVTVVPSARSVTRQASVGNYWYQDDQQRDQTKIVVRQGDQITFTVREAAVPGHTVDVDPLNIHSPNLQIGQTYTTPRLTRTGNFYLYCRPHEQRGHHTRLVVLAPPKSTPPPAPRSTPTRTAPAARASRTSAPRSPAPTPPPRTPAPEASLTPVGVGTAPPEAMARPIATNPNSLRALTGRTASRVPWTRSLWWLAAASVPIMGAAGLALRRARIAQYQPKVSDLRRARGVPTPATPATQRRKSKTASAKSSAKSAARRKPPRKGS